MDRYKAVNDWLIEYEPFYSWVQFNAIRTELSAVAFKTVPTVGKIGEDICGNITMEMPLMMDLVKAYDMEGGSDTNFEAISEIEAFVNWVTTQNVIQNFPVFEQNEEITKIEVTQRVPTLAIDKDANLAHYQFQFKITYKVYKK